MGAYTVLRLSWIGIIFKKRSRECELGESLDEIIDTLETSRTHVKKWVRRYNEGNCDFKDLPRSGRPQKIDEKKKKK